MSAEARPISPTQFALAIQDLPAENLYTKAQEIQNSVSHLKRSNAQLQEYSDSIKDDATSDERARSEGDKDCLEAIRENDIVIERQLNRIDLIKKEIERRGGRWHEANDPSATNGTDNASFNQNADPAPSRHPSGRVSVAQTGLTDEELRRRLEEQMRDDEDDGMHL